MSEVIDDDVFKYSDSQMTQCISGFGRNAMAVVREEVKEWAENDDPESTPADRIKWHFDELVRWCRHFNGEYKRTMAILEKQAKCHKGLELDHWMSIGLNKEKWFVYFRATEVNCYLSPTSAPVGHPTMQEALKVATSAELLEKLKARAAAAGVSIVESDPAGGGA